VAVLKNLDRCYIVGQWIVIAEEHRIQKEGLVVGMASNIIDALLPDQGEG
jgi:hypothetical protein